MLYGWTYSFDYSVDDKFITSSINNIDNTFEGFLAIFKTWFAVPIIVRFLLLLFGWKRKFNGISSPHVSHVVNVFLFACILCKTYDFIVVSKLYTDSKKLLLLVILSSFIFAIHPNHVSVVANIKARDNLLSMLFGLYAAIQLIHFFDTKKYIRVFTFLIFITIAFLSKLDAYIFIVTPLLVIFFFREIDRKKLLINIAITLGLYLLAFIIFAQFKSQLNQKEFIFSIGFDENPLVANNTFINRIAVALSSLFYYLKFLVVPFGYYFFFGYNQIPLTGLFSVINIIAIVVVLLLFFMLQNLLKKPHLYI